MKIHIIGPVGSGKTTLANDLGKRFDMDVISIDQLVWERHPGGDIRRADAEISALLAQRIQRPSWIIEGVHARKWVLPSLVAADYILYYEPSYKTRRYRINKRFIKQKLHLEQALYKPTTAMWRKMHGWSRLHEEKSRFETEAVQVQS